MLYIEDLDKGIAYYGQSLGFKVTVFGKHPGTEEPLIAAAKLQDATVLLTNEELFRDQGNVPTGSVRLYFHLDKSVDDLYAQIKEKPDVDIVQGPTNQMWGDRTLIVRDPWGVMLVFSMPAYCG